MLAAHIEDSKHTYKLDFFRILESKSRKTTKKFFITEIEHLVCKNKNCLFRSKDTYLVMRGVIKILFGYGYG